MWIFSRRENGSTLQVRLARLLAMLALLLSASGPALAAPIAFVQSNSVTPQSPQTTVTVTYTAAQTLGNLNVVVVGWNDSTATVSSVSDSRGNGYALAAAAVVQSGTASQAIYYAKNISAAVAGANTVTVTFSVAAAFPDIRIAEYSGLDTVNPLDVSVGAQGTTTTSNSGSVTTSSANDLLVGANLVQSSSLAAGAGYTNRGITLQDGDILEDRVVTVAGSYNATAVLDRVQAWIMQMAAFRAAGGGTPAPSISSVNPGSGGVGSSVTISGANLGGSQGTSTVTFNGKGAGGASTWNATAIVIAVPTGATTGSVVVTVGGVSSNGMAFTVTGPPASVTASGGTPQSAAINTGFTAPLVATVTDAGNNGVSGVVVTFTAPTSGASGSFAGGLNTATTNGSGVAASAAFTANATVGGPYNVVASATGATSANFSLTNLAAPAAKVVVTSGSGQSAAINTGFTAPLVATVTDAGNNGVSGVVVTFTAPTSGASGSFAGGLNTATTNGSGVAASAAFTANATAGGPYNVTASVAGVATPASFSLTNLPGAAAPIAFVQSNSVTPQSPQTTVTVNYTGAQTAGNLNVVVVGWNDSTATVVSVTDSKGNSYALAAPPVVQGGTATQAIYYARDIFSAAAGANTVTVTFSSAARFPDIRIAEYSGIDPASPLDQSVGAQGNSATSNSGAVTTTSANELLIGANLVQSTTTGPGTGYTSRVLSGDGDILEDQIATTVGSYAATAALDRTQLWIMQMASFRAASGTSGATPTAPSNLTATLAGSLQINLSWTASTETGGTISRYLIERCQGVGCSAFAQINTSPTTAFSDIGLSGSTSYTYRVRATDALGALSAYSNLVSATSGLSISPRVTDLTFTRTQQFTASAPASWLVDGVIGGAAATGTITSNGLYTPPNSAGIHAVTAQAQSQSANGTVYVTNYPGTFMRDVDASRTGQNLAETVLTTANVNSSQFGKLLSYPIDGVSDASPLYVANVNIPGQGFHNVVYVATEHDSVYAFDAEGVGPNPLWKVSFINPAAGITTITPSDTGDCCPSDMPIESGITGTPVIDPASGTLYVVAVTKEITGSTTSFIQRLHALDITTGAEKFGGPIVIQPSVPGTGDGSSSGQVPFDALHENQRAALLLTNGIVYIAWAGHADRPPYHGWVVGYNVNAATLTLQQTVAYNVSPNGSDGGIWQSGDGLTTDSTGRIYFVSGNGDFNVDTGGTDYGDSVVALNQNGTVSDYFTPHDQANMAASDLDMGSGGVLLLPDQSGPHVHEAVTGGKNGTIYVVDRDSLGHYNPNNDNQIVQALVNIFPGGTFQTGNFKAPVYFNGHVYFSADKDNIKVFTVTNGLLSTTPSSQASLVPGYPGATLQISANGATNGILWALERVGTDQTGVGTVGPGVLHAFDATNLATELYNSNQAAGGRDTLDNSAKWAAPLIANGKVFVATNGQLTVFGLLP